MDEQTQVTPESTEQIGQAEQAPTEQTAVAPEAQATEPVAEATPEQPAA